MRRRTLLTALGAGALSLAGCTTGSDPTDTGTAPQSGTDQTGGIGAGTDEQPASVTDETTGAATDRGTDTSTGDGTDEQRSVPSNCPTSQGLDVEWPTDLDSASAASFVEEYENTYYRETVVEFEQESRLDSYELSGSVSGRSGRVDGGWVVEYSGSGGVYRPSLLLEASTAEPPAGADPVAVSDLEYEPIASVVTDAAESGDVRKRLDRDEIDVDASVDHLASLSEAFERFSDPGDEGTLYVDADGTTVELTVHATRLHGDYWWTARYYVSETVVRRTDDEDTDPTEGELLECRTAE